MLLDAQTLEPYCLGLNPTLDSLLVNETWASIVSFKIQFPFPVFWQGEALKFILNKTKVIIVHTS